MNQINKLFVLLSILIFIGTLNCCKGTTPTNESPDQIDTLNFLNITVLLDLSNRIDPNNHPNQIQRDTLIIKEILSKFLNNVKNNGYNYSKDKIQVLIAPQPENNAVMFNPHIDIEEILNENKIVRQVLPVLEKEFTKEVTDIYLDNPIFNGADIYNFFKDNTENTFIKNSYLEKYNNEGIYYYFHNKMVILTDGYLNFEPTIQNVRCKNNSCMQISALRNDINWKDKFPKYKLKSIENKDFQSLEVMLLEISPLHPEVNTLESEIIEMYWKSWFEDMGIKYQSMHQSSESIPIINSAIKYFLLNE